MGILPESIPCAVCPPLAAAATCPRNTQSLPRFSPFPGQLGPALGMGLKASCLHTTGSPCEHQPCWPGEEVGRSLAPITHMFQAQKCGYSGRDAITSSSWGYGARAASAGTFSYLLETLSCCGICLFVVWATNMAFYKGVCGRWILMAKLSSATVE